MPSGPCSGRSERQGNVFYTRTSSTRREATMTFDDMSFDDWELTLTAFQLAYGFLSKVFYEEPHTDLMAALVEGNLFAEWPLSRAEPATDFGLTLMRAFQEGWSPQALPDLRWDYTRLFIGPGPVLAPPWESVYRSRDRLLFDAATLDVRQAYAHFGLQAPRLNHEPDDHLGLELAFMFHLCDLGVQAAHDSNPAQLTTALAAQRDFLGQHLFQWAPDCLALVTEHAHSDYYRGAAHLTLGTLKQAAVLLGVAPSREVRP